MSPSARDVEEVVLSALRRGEWARAASLLVGAVQLQCIPTVRTYSEVIAAVALNGTWEHTVRITDTLQTSPLSNRALLCAAADTLLMKPDGNVAEKLFRVILAARHRRVQMEARHHVHCSRLLLRVGNWRHALTVGAYGRLVQHIPALASATMFAASVGRRWVEGSKIMAGILMSGAVPDADVARDYIRCFTPTGPWWRALGLVSVLACRSDPIITDAAQSLLAGVASVVGQRDVNAKKERYREILRLVRCHSSLQDVTEEEAVHVLNFFDERQWEEALTLMRTFPSLLKVSPRPRAVLLPMTGHKIGTCFCHHWELVWKTVSSTFDTSSAEHVFDAATCFASYMLSSCNESKEGSKCEETMELVGSKVSSSLISYRANGGELPEHSVLTSFVRVACECGWWQEALLISQRQLVVFAELVENGPWQSAIAVYGRMLPSSQERADSKLEHLFISKGLWVPALQYAQKRLPWDTAPLRNLSILICGALGQWDRTLYLLDRYVSSPTELEESLRRACIVKGAEDSLRIACEAEDWAKALLFWSVVYPLPRRRGTYFPEGRDRQSEMHPRAVKQLAMLLLASQRYDECCAVVSAHTPTPSDPVVLRCLQLFNSVRSSPLTYGRLLQRYRQSHKARIALVDCFVILALCVSNNLSGAFSILQQLTSLQLDRSGKGNSVCHEVEEVPHLKTYLPLILLAAAVPSRATEVEAVIISLASCIRSIDDVNLFNKPLLKLWESDMAEPRACAFRAATAILRHSVAQKFPLSWTVMSIVAKGLDDSAHHSLIRVLCESAEHRLKFDANAEQHGADGIKCRNEAEVVFQCCARAFGRRGQWEHALSSIQHCEVIDTRALFNMILFAKEMRQRRLAMTHHVMQEFSPQSCTHCDKPTRSPGTHVPRDTVKGALAALTDLQAWRAALVAFGSEEVQADILSDVNRQSSSVAIGQLLSCVAVSGPWELSLRLLGVVYRTIVPNCCFAEKGFTDVLRAVHCGSGAVMCSRVVLFLVEIVGVAPTPEQYRLLLRSCLETKLTVVERELCAGVLKRLSGSLNEMQIVDLVSSISDPFLPPDQWNSEDHSGANRYFLRTAPPKQSGIWQHASLKGWMEAQTPPLSNEELDQLCDVAPLVIILNVRDLEKLSRQFLGGRFASFDLFVVLRQYESELMERLERNSGDSVNLLLVEHCKGARLLHIMLLPYEPLSHRMLCAGDEPSVRSFLQKVRWEVFRGFASIQTVAAVWEACRLAVLSLAAGRWPRLCECELLAEVKRGNGRPPTSLITRQNATRRDIAKYWATYGRIVWPELYFSAPELCQLAVYVPLLEPLLRREHELRELVFGIHASHFAPHSIPEGDLLLRRPRSPEAIRAVIHLVFGRLKRLYCELDADERGACRYYHHKPDMDLWRRMEHVAQEQHQHDSGSPAHGKALDRVPRWSLALRILHHYRRCTRATLGADVLAALFSACAADTRGIGDSIAHCKSCTEPSREVTWWMLSISCARLVEPNLTFVMWRHAMQLAMVAPRASSTKILPVKYRLEDITDISTRTTMRVLLSQVSDVDGGGVVAFSTSLLLIDNLKELLSDPPGIPYCRFCSDGYPIDSPTEAAGPGERDALVVWGLLLSHRCLPKMEPLHAEVVKRVLLGKVTSTLKEGMAIMVSTRWLGPHLEVIFLCTLLGLPCLCEGWFYSSASVAEQPSSKKVFSQTDGGHSQERSDHSPTRMEFPRGKGTGVMGSGHLSRLWAEVEAKGSVSSCWKKALDSLKVGCASLHTNDGARNWLALMMAACDDETDGRRRGWPRCQSEEQVHECIYNLDDTRYLVYVQYKLHTDILCLYIQEETFQERTEAAVHALRTSSAAAAETLSAIHLSSKELHSSIEDAAKQQKSNIEETRRLHVQLQDIQHGQTIAFESLEGSTQHMMKSVGDASSRLQRLHTAIDEGAARSVAALRSVAQEAEAFQSRTELHVTGMLHGLERLEVFLQALMEGTVGLSEVLRGAALVTMVLLLTTPERTSGARFPCLFLAATAYVARPMFSKVVHDAINPRTFVTMLAFAELAVLAYYAFMHCAPEEALRRLLRKEVRCALNEVWAYQLEDINTTVDSAVSTALSIIASDCVRQGCLRDITAAQSVSAGVLKHSDAAKVVRASPGRSRSRRDLAKEPQR